MVYDITDLNAQDQFDHENMIFSKDLMLCDDDNDEDYEIIDYCDDTLIRFNKNDQLIITQKGSESLVIRNICTTEALFPIQTEGSRRTYSRSNNAVWSQYFIWPHHTYQV